MNLRVPQNSVKYLSASATISFSIMTQEHTADKLRNNAEQIPCRYFSIFAKRVADKWPVQKVAFYHGCSACKRPREHLHSVRTRK
jgi:hypothetical protein